MDPKEKPEEKNKKKTKGGEAQMTKQQTKFKKTAEKGSSHLLSSLRFEKTTEKKMSLRKNSGRTATTTTTTTTEGERGGKTKPAGATECSTPLELNKFLSFFGVLVPLARVHSSRRDMFEREQRKFKGVFLDVLSDALMADIQFRREWERMVTERV